MSEVVDYQKALDEWLAKQRKRRMVLTDEDAAGCDVLSEPDGVFATGGLVKAEEAEPFWKHPDGGPEWIVPVTGR